MHDMRGRWREASPYKMRQAYAGHGNVLAVGFSFFFFFFFFFS